MRTFRQSRIVLARAAVALLLGLISSVSMAGLLSLNPISTGSIQRTDGITASLPITLALASFKPLGSLYYLPPIPPGQIESTVNTHGYLLFDLSAVSFNVSAASIEFDLGYDRSAAPNLTVTGLSLMQTQALSAIPVGSFLTRDVISGTPEEQAVFISIATAYDAIGSGEVLGALTDSGPLTGSYTIGLNASALDLINAGDGLLGLGLTWTPHGDVVFDPATGVFEAVPDTLTFNGAPRLILNSANSIPLPASKWLLGSALLGLIATKRKPV